MCNTVVVHIKIFFSSLKQVSCRRVYRHVRRQYVAKMKWWHLTARGQWGGFLGYPQPVFELMSLSFVKIRFKSLVIFARMWLYSFVIVTISVVRRKILSMSKKLKWINVRKGLLTHKRIRSTKPCEFWTKGSKICYIILNFDDKELFDANGFWTLNVIRLNEFAHALTIRSD